MAYAGTLPCEGADWDKQRTDAVAGRVGTMSAAPGKAVVDSNQKQVAGEREGKPAAGARWSAMDQWTSDAVVAEEDSVVDVVVRRVHWRFALENAPVTAFPAEGAVFFAKMTAWKGNSASGGSYEARMETAGYWKANG